MSISVKPSKQGMLRMFYVFLSITLFCGLFSFVYEQFSHHVYSNYMIYLFLFPLVGGVLPYGILATMRNARVPSRFAINAYNSGIAALTVGSAMKGALDIYGTASDYILVYWIAGTVLVLDGILRAAIRDFTGSI